MLGDLSERGVKRLIVEGGGSIRTQFLTEGPADELQLVIAPSFVGDPRAPRLVDDGTFPSPDHGEGIWLGTVQQIGDLVLLRYALSKRFVNDERVVCDLPLAPGDRPVAEAIVDGKFSGRVCHFHDVADLECVIEPLRVVGTDVDASM